MKLKIFLTLLPWLVVIVLLAAGVPNADYEVVRATTGYF